MLYLKTNIAPNSLLGIWKTEESAEDFLSMLDEKCLLQEDVFSSKSPKRILEKLATRALLRDMVGRETRILHHPSGKPYLASKDNISISHTTGYVAVLLTDSPTCGIDIEHISEKVKRVKERFVSEKEYIDPKSELRHLLLHWSAKETVYKIVDNPSIVLKDDAIVQPFLPSDKGLLEVHFSSRNLRSTYPINYIANAEFVLTYCFESK